jgi:hypothetical protein
VGLERAHAQFLGQSQGLLVGGYGLLNIRRHASRRNVAEEMQSICLVATFLVCMGMRQRLLGKDLRLFQAARQHLRFPQEETTALLGSTLSIVVTCAPTCVSNGTASVTRPTSVYATLKTAAIQAK